MQIDASGMISDFPKSAADGMELHSYGYASPSTADSCSMIRCPMSMLVTLKRAYVPVCDCNFCEMQSLERLYAAHVGLAHDGRVALQNLYHIMRQLVISIRGSDDISVPLPTYGVLNIAFRFLKSIVLEQSKMKCSISKIEIIDDEGKMSVWDCSADTRDFALEVRISECDLSTVSTPPDRSTLFSDRIVPE